MSNSISRRLLLILSVVTAMGFANPTTYAAGSLRFFGAAVPNVNRVMIRLDPHVPADVGAGDFTLEFWMKANAAENMSNGSCRTGSNENWITGNIIFDRAIWEHDRHGDYGLSMFSNGSSGATLAFGMFKSGGGAVGLCGSRNVADGRWHHVAVTRSVSGPIRIYVDGQLDVQGTGPSGDVSYANGVPSRVPSYIRLNVDNYLGIGAEKYDADPVRYPSYNGFVDEVRISSSIRYTGAFTPPGAPFTPDAQTAALYHLDEGSGNIITDSAPGGASVGERRYGGNPAGPVWSTDTPFTSAPSVGAISFTSGTYSVAESATGVTIGVQRLGGSSGAASVAYQTGGGSAAAGTDYTSASGILQWANGENGTKSFTVSPLEDSLVEGTETINLTLSDATGPPLGSPNTAVVSIADNDTAAPPAPAGTLQFSASSFSVSEGTATATVSVSRVGGSAGSATVRYQTGGGTATAGSDYTATSGTLQWAAGDTSTKSFTIAVVNDTAVESSETVGLALSNVTGATLGSPSSTTLTITDNDTAAPPSGGAGTVQFTTGAVSVVEGNTTVTLTVSRTGSTSSAASVRYRTSEGTATNGSDFQGANGTLQWAAGSAVSQPISITIYRDGAVEGNETVRVTLSSPSGVSLGSPSVATITIEDVWQR